MSKKQLVLWMVLGDFVALTAWAIYSEGYLAFVPVAAQLATASAWGAQIVVDFLLALAVALGFVVVDARRRGLAWWPFALLTLTLGSIGPLSYLIFRERAAVPTQVRQAVHA